MLRISYVKKTCPQCGDVYKICKSKTQTSVGSLIINCKNVENGLWIQVLWSRRNGTWCSGSGCISCSGDNNSFLSKNSEIVRCTGAS